MAEQPSRKYGSRMRPRSAQSPDGRRGQAPGSSAGQLQPGHIQSLKHGAHWVLNREADTPLPEDMPISVRERVEEARSGLAVAWRANGLQTDMPFQRMGLGIISRLNTALICLDRHIERFGFIKGLEVTGPTHTWMKIMARLSREMDRWGLNPTARTRTSTFEIDRWKQDPEISAVLVEQEPEEEPDENEEDDDEIDDEGDEFEEDEEGVEYFWDHDTESIVAERVDDIEHGIVKEHSDCLDAANQAAHQAASPREYADNSGDAVNSMDVAAAGEDSEDRDCGRAPEDDDEGCDDLEHGIVKEHSDCVDSSCREGDSGNTVDAGEEREDVDDDEECDDLEHGTIKEHLIDEPATGKGSGDVGDAGDAGDTGDVDTADAPSASPNSSFDARRRPVVLDPREIGRQISEGLRRTAKAQPLAPRRRKPSSGRGGRKRRKNR